VAGSDAAARTLSKHELQYTGRSFLGWNGTTAWPPQLLQIAAWYSRVPPGVVARARFAAARQVEHRWGSLVRPLLAKNDCSPDEKMNDSPQSLHVSVRSWNTPHGPPCPRNAGRSRVRRGVADRGARRRNAAKMGWLWGPGSLCAPNDTRGVKRIFDTGNHAGPAVVRVAMPNKTVALTRLPVLAVVAAAAIACSPSGAATAASTGPGASASGSPSAAPASPSPSVAGIDHPTGASDVVLRFDEAGGFVPAEFIAAHVPLFTLYGDGTVVFVSNRPPAEQPPNAIPTGQPIRTARLSEDQLQDLLEFALKDGGLALARTDYQNLLVADAATATFEIHAAGDAKTVSVLALGMDGEPGADTAIKAQFVKLADRLRDFDHGGSLASAAFAPAAYRGVLIDAAGVRDVPIRPWPWPGLTPADFQLPKDPNVLQQRTRSLTDAEAKALGVDGYRNGIVGGLFVTGPEGKLYSVVVRPLLPGDEA
jgi:hypothetical protein